MTHDTYHPSSIEKIPSFFISLPFGIGLLISEIWEGLNIPLPLLVLSTLITTWVYMFFAYIIVIIVVVVIIGGTANADHQLNSKQS